MKIIFRPRDDPLAYNQVMRLFFAFPKKAFGMTQIAKLTNISKTTANKIIKRLEKEQFLNIETIGNVWRITCNTNHPYNQSRKVPYHLTMILESGITSIVSQKIPNFKAIVLFGSYKKGTDTEHSDIDIGVEVVGSQETRISEIGRLNMKYRKKIPVNIHLFSKKTVDQNLYANILNGIVLKGFLEP